MKKVLLSIRHITVWLLLLFLSTANAANYRKVKVGTGISPLVKNIELQSWLKPQYHSILKKAREDERANKYSVCYKGIHKIPLENSGPLRPWVIYKKYDCLFKWYQQKKSKELEALLYSGVQLISQEKKELPQSTGALDQLKNINRDVGYHLLKTFASSNRRKAWVLFDALVEDATLFSNGQLADVYEIGAGMAFAEQDWLVSLKHYRAANNLAGSPSYVEKIEFIEKKLGVASAAKEEVVAGPISSEVDTEAQRLSKKELQLVSRFRKFTKENDVIAFIDVGSELLTEFPKSKNAEFVAQNIRSALLGLSANGSEKIKRAKAKAFKYAKKSPQEFIASWANSLYYRGRYDDALDLYKELTDSDVVKEIEGETLINGGLAAVAVGHYQEAAAFYEAAIKFDQGKPSADEALYRRGLAYIRLQKWEQAASDLEKYILISGNGNFNLQAHFWLIRTYDQMGKDAGTLKVYLAQRYPLSYYGLQIRIASDKGVLKLEEHAPITEEWALSPTEFMAWKRYHLLKSLNWLSEAQKEIPHIMSPQTAEDHILISRLWYEVKGYNSSVATINKVWETHPQYSLMPSLQWVYPADHLAELTKESNKYGIESYLVQALIKQESAYIADAVSPAGAMGLMQLMKPTARETAKLLRYNQFNSSSSMFDPQLNIKFGTHYLNRMIRAFNGYIPLALASYNVGIGNIRKWLLMREDLKTVEQTGTSEGFGELWVDELPWSETSFYVKAIMRNLLAYRMIDQGLVYKQEKYWVKSEKDKQAQ